MKKRIVTIAVIALFVGIIAPKMLGMTTHESTYRERLRVKQEINSVKETLATAQGPARKELNKRLSSLRVKKKMLYAKLKAIELFKPSLKGKTYPAAPTVEPTPAPAPAPQAPEPRQPAAPDETVLREYQQFADLFKRKADEVREATVAIMEDPNRVIPMIPPNLAAMLEQVRQIEQTINDKRITRGLRSAHNMIKRYTERQATAWTMKIQWLLRQPGKLDPGWVPEIKSRAQEIFNVLGEYDRDEVSIGPLRRELIRLEARGTAEGQQPTPQPAAPTDDDLQKYQKFAVMFKRLADEVRVATVAIMEDPNRPIPIISPNLEAMLVSIRQIERAINDKRITRGMRSAHNMIKRYTERQATAWTMKIRGLLRQPEKPDPGRVQEIKSRAQEIFNVLGEYDRDEVFIGPLRRELIRLEARGAAEGQI